MFRTIMLAAASLLASGNAARAQQNLANMVPPAQTIDSNGVDLISGKASIRIPLAEFDKAATDLSFVWTYLTPAQYGSNEARSNLRIGGESGYIGEVGEIMNVWFGDNSGIYRGYQGLWVLNSDGSSMSLSIGPTHVQRMHFPDSSKNGIYNSEGDWTPEDGSNRIIRANGEVWQEYSQNVSVAAGVLCPNCQATTLNRLRFVVSSKGYGIQWLYNFDGTPANATQAASWSSFTKITPYNKSEVYCNEAALAECTSLSGLPSKEVIYPTFGTILFRNTGETDGIEVSSATNSFSVRNTAVPNSTVTYESGTYTDPLAEARYVKKVTNADGSWNYDYVWYPSEDGHMIWGIMTRTDPEGHTIQAEGYPLFGYFTWMIDELYRITDGGAPGGNDYRMSGTSPPEGNGIGVERDYRNNITKVTAGPKNGSSASPITLAQATYPSECTNPRTCNKPTSVTDGNGNVTDYTYDAASGGVLTETGPAVNGVRPQKRYQYALRYPWLKNNSGGYSQGANGIWLLSQESFCRTTAASGSGCAGGSADEVVTSYDYGPNSGPNTLLLRGVVVTADGTSLRTCYGYDSKGHKIFETKPRAGLTACN